MTAIGAAVAAAESGAVRVTRDMGDHEMTYWYPSADPASAAAAEFVQAPGRAVAVTTYAEPGVGINPGAAANRRVVLLPDGRTARLVYAPAPVDDLHARHRSPGSKARVLLSSGAHLSFDPAVLVLVREHGL